MTASERAIEAWRTYGFKRAAAQRPAASAAPAARRMKKGAKGRKYRVALVFQAPIMRSRTMG